MNIDEIKQALQNWEEARSSTPQMIETLSQGNGFHLRTPTIEPPVGDDEFLHVYPGIFEGRLKFFIIPQDRDTVEQYHSPKGILPFIEIQDVQQLQDPDFPNNNLGDSEIPWQIAERRIDHWNNQRDPWIAETVPSHVGIYQAFAVPMQDLTGETLYSTYFSLSGSVLPEFKADLVLWDHETNTLVPPAKNYGYGFFDTVRPVPPFGGQVPLSSFFLLELATVPA